VRQVITIENQSKINKEAKSLANTMSKGKNLNEKYRKKITKKRLMSIWVSILYSRPGL
jgi:hypothetical protein